MADVESARLWLAKELHFQRALLNAFLFLRFQVLRMCQEPNSGGGFQPHDNRGLIKSASDYFEMPNCQAIDSLSWLFHVLQSDEVGRTGETVTKQRSWLVSQLWADGKGRVG